jgi:hypothetical protein
MCNFFSAVITKKEVLWDKMLDNHSELLEKFGLKDTSKVPDFVKVELTADMREADLTKWVFKVDQDIFPKWWTASKERTMTKECYKVLEECLKEVRLFEGSKEIKEGRLFVYGSSSAELWNSSSAELRDSSSAILWNSSSAKLCGSSSAKLCGSSSAELWNSSSAILWNSSSATKYSNLAKVVLKAGSQAVCIDRSGNNEVKVTIADKEKDIEC